MDFRKWTQAEDNVLLQLVAEFDGDVQMLYKSFHNIIFEGTRTLTAMAARLKTLNEKGYTIPKSVYSALRNAGERDRSKTATADTVAKATANTTHITTKEAAALLGMRKESVNNLIYRNKLSSYMEHGHHMIPKLEVEQYRDARLHSSITVKPRAQPKRVETMSSAGLSSADMAYKIKWVIDGFDSNFLSETQSINLIKEIVAKEIAPRDTEKHS